VFRKATAVIFSAAMLASIPSQPAFARPLPPEREATLAELIGPMAAAQQSRSWVSAEALDSGARKVRVGGLVL